MPCLNFVPEPSYPQLEVWAEDAERMLWTTPDLTLYRCRQLVELLVRVVKHESDEKIGGDLAKQIFVLARLGKISPDVQRDLEWVRKEANDAVHVSGFSVVGQGAWQKKARTALFRTAGAWAAHRGRKRKEELIPPVGDAAKSAFRTAMFRLDMAELLGDRRQEGDRAEAALSKISLSDLRYADVSSDDLLLVALRIDSIRLAIANHRGQIPGPIDDERSRKVFATGDGAAFDELVHYLNRHAVGHLNGARFDEALTAISSLEEWRSASADFAPSALSDVPIRDWQRGALLGTKGQALAFRAHALGDPELIDEAIACFDEALTNFTDPGDRERQQTYRFHALIERVRLGGKASPEDLAELEQAIRDAPVDDVMQDDWHPAAFRVSVCLKASWVTGLKVPWLSQLERFLNAQPVAALPHPYEQLVGGLAQLRGSNTSASLRDSLQATAEGKKDPLAGWIAACHLATARGSSTPIPPHSALRDWWTTNEIAARTNDKGPLSAVPFNYA